jgi:hypothetical protein
VAVRAWRRCSLWDPRADACSRQQWLQATEAWSTGDTTVEAQQQRGMWGSARGISLSRMEVSALSERAAGIQLGGQCAAGARGRRRCVSWGRGRQ